MENYFDTFLYSLFKILLYLALSLTAAGTVLIPTFLNDKMLKAHRNHIYRLSLKNKWNLLDRWGKRFVFCFVFSGILGFALSKLDGKESEFQSKKDFDIKLSSIAKQDSISTFFRDSLANVKGDLNASKNREQVAKVQDSVQGVKTLLLAKNFQYEKLALELKVANLERVSLEKQLNSPVIEEVELPEFQNINPCIILDSLSNTYTFWVSYENTGKGRAEHVQAKFYAMDINTLKILYVSKGTYDDSSDILIDGNIGSKAYKLTTNNKAYREYVVFTLNYRNQFGKQMPEFIKVYLVDLRYVKQNIPRVKTVLATEVKGKFYKLRNDYN